MSCTYCVGTPFEFKTQMALPSGWLARWAIAMHEKMSSAVICVALMATPTPVDPTTPR